MAGGVYNPWAPVGPQGQSVDPLEWIWNAITAPSSGPHPSQSNVVPPFHPQSGFGVMRPNIAEDYRAQRQAGPGGVMNTSPPTGGPMEQSPWDAFLRDYMQMNGGGAGGGGGFKFGYSPVDYGQGFPGEGETPQRGAPDYGEADKYWERSQPTKPEIDPWDKWTALLGGMAAGASGARTFGEGMGRAGAQGSAAYLSEKRYESALDQEYTKSMENWNLNRAQTLGGRAENSSELDFQNDQLLYQRKLALHEINIQNQKEKQTQVQSAQDGFLITQFNPERKSVV